MWKRRTHQADRVIGSPTLFETSLDEESFAGLTNLNNGEFSISARPAFGRRKSVEVIGGLPELPFKYLQEPTTTIQGATSETSALSSIYSQPSPDDRHNLLPEKLEIPRASSVYPDDVSPPDTPRMSSRRQSRHLEESPGISPISQSPKPSLEQGLESLPHNSKRSSLNGNGTSALKKSSRFGGAGALFSNWKGRTGGLQSADRDANLTRWDDFSGEPTTSEKGKPAQAALEAHRFDSPLHTKSNQSVYRSPGFKNNANPPRSKLFGYASKVPMKAAAQSPEVQENRHDANGQYMIGQALKNKPLPPWKSLSSPIESQKRSVTLPEQSSSRQTRQSVRHLPAREDSSVSACSEDEELMKPPVPLKTGKNTRPKIVTSPASQETVLQLDPSPVIKDLRSPLVRNPSKEAMQSEPAPCPANVTPPSSGDYKDSGFSEKQFGAAMRQFSPNDQLPSRFSTTTYATTNAYDSPPATPDSQAELPTSNTPPPSILDRKRPVPAASVISKKTTSRKPVASNTSVAPPGNSANKRFSKSLPKSPPEVEAVDRVSALQAALDNLRRRRANLQTVIHELTHVIQPSSIAYDNASRQEIKKTVEGLNKELAEVMKEEHETGLKLHRAWKRLDSNSYEPTGLWVRRVTG